LRSKSIYPAGKVTGYFGALTLQAIERFQKKYGITKAGKKVTARLGR
jgi:peptidoglycan hydrolase-like protein with peptidoglycan-binding domain